MGWDERAVRGLGTPDVREERTHVSDDETVANMGHPANAGGFPFGKLRVRMTGV